MDEILFEEYDFRSLCRISGMSIYTFQQINQFQGIASLVLAFLKH